MRWSPLGNLQNAMLGKVRLLLVICWLRTFDFYRRIFPFKHPINIKLTNYRTRPTRKTCLLWEVWWFISETPGGAVLPCVHTCVPCSDWCGSVDICGAGRHLWRHDDKQRDAHISRRTSRTSRGMSSHAAPRSCHVARRTTDGGRPYFDWNQNICNYIESGTWYAFSIKATLIKLPQNNRMKQNAVVLVSGRK